MVFRGGLQRAEGAVEEVGGEADDAFDIALADEIAADFGFGVASEEDAMGEDAGSFAAAFEGADDVEEVGVIALFGGGAPKCLKRSKGSLRG